MSMSNAFENALTLLILQNTNIANIGDATGLRGSSTAGSLYVSLHTADPGEGGAQNTSETSYGSYARVAVARTSGGWTVSSNVGSNAAAVTFATCTSGTATITHVGIGSSSSGTGLLMFSYALDTALSVSTGVTPSFPIGDLFTTAD